MFFSSLIPHPCLARVGLDLAEGHGGGLADIGVFILQRRVSAGTASVAADPISPRA